MEKYILKNDFLQIEYLKSALRIIELTFASRTNMLADVSGFPSITTPYGIYDFRGGHRLWHSPEAMPRTYIPDTPVTVTELADGITLESETEPGTGIRKRIEIHLAKDKPSVKLTHTLINDGLWMVELAPWAITQFRLGGTVILPMPIGDVDPAGLLPNRQISLWPYTRINDPRVKWDDEYVLFNADALVPPFKIGYFNPYGWMAYWLEDVLFRKSFEARKDRNYPDNNCNAEMYCNDYFVELESLAPLTKLAPNETVVHVETWDVFSEPDALPPDIKKVLSKA